MNSKYNVKNSFEFLSKISDLKLKEDEMLISFDVKSLFTSVPREFALKIIDERWSDIEMHTPIPKDEFFEILNFILYDCNQFVYKGHFYKQLEGTPMGLPMSPILADIVMERILDCVIPKFSFTPKVFCKYVDDLFCVIPKSI